MTIANQAQTKPNATSPATAKSPPPAKASVEEEEEEVDIDLEDPEVEKAALKIQAGFRGMRTRNTMKTNQVRGDNFY